MQGAPDGEAGRTSNERIRAAPSSCQQTCSPHLPKGINQVDHLVPHVVNLIEQLHVVELFLGGGPVQVELLAQVMKDGVGLAHALVAIDDVRQVGEGIHGQDGRLAVFEPSIEVAVLFVLELGLRRANQAYGFQYGGKRLVLQVHSPQSK